MKKLILPACFMAAIAISCQSDTNSESDAPVEGDNTEAVVPTGADGAPEVIESENPFTIDPATPINGGQPAQPAAAGGTTAGLNPAHGQPGHRCDIPEGAPLDSPPQDPGASSPTPIELSPSGQPTTIQPGSRSVMEAPSGPTTQPATIPSSGGTTPPGVNPPHGEPGHDCSVNVGAPLPK